MGAVFEDKVHQKNVPAQYGSVAIISGSIHLNKAHEIV